MKQSLTHLRNLFLTALDNGAWNAKDIINKHRLLYFNAILLALPAVYMVFIFIDIGSYIRPLRGWYFDQWGFFIFVFICIVSYGLNRIGYTIISKLLFILTWPVIMHIVPVIIMDTPPDYYYAYPMGLIFHSILIQVIFCSKKSPWLFWVLLGGNFVLAINSIAFLQYNDNDMSTAIYELSTEKYFLLVIILYWLLFNMIVYHLMHIIDRNVEKTHKSKSIIEEQKNELEATLEKLRQSQDQLIQSEKLASLGVFTAGISHELNNPINYIASGASALFTILDSLSEHALTSNSEYKKELPNIEKTKQAIELGVDKASSIISSLRNYTHTGGDEFSEYNCINCIKDSVTLLSGSIKGRIKIIENFPDQMNIVCNPGKMNQAFFNILNNAVQAISSTGEICVTAFITNRKEAVFEFKDTGCGIAADTVNKIFDPFYTTREIGKGTGLGLFIVHSIIEEHKGKVEVESVLGSGSLFRVIIPIS